MLFGSHGNSGSGVRKNATFSERANMALSNLQRNSYAMSVIRGRLESRLGQAAGSRGSESQELPKMLELIKSGERLLNEMAAKVESARVLEEFIVILDAAAASVGEIASDMGEMVPAAERALEEMHDTIMKTTIGAPQSPEQESEKQNIMREAASASVCASPQHSVSVEEFGNSARANIAPAPEPESQENDRQEEPVPA